MFAGLYVINLRAHMRLKILKPISEPAFLRASM